MLLQSSDDMEEVLDISKDNLEALKEEAALVKPETLIRYIRVFSELSSQVKFASQKRIMVEIDVYKRQVLPSSPITGSTSSIVLSS